MAQRCAHVAVLFSAQFSSLTKTCRLARRLLELMLHLAFAAVAALYHCSTGDDLLAPMRAAGTWGSAPGSEQLLHAALPALQQAAEAREAAATRDLQRALQEAHQQEIELHTLGQELQQALAAERSRVRPVYDPNHFCTGMVVCQKLFGALHCT